jgi:hypothetical protein
MRIFWELLPKLFKAATEFPFFQTKAPTETYFCPSTNSQTMYILLISIVIGLFVAMLFVNVYFRVKVLKSYRKLIKARVEFGAAHLFNKEKMEAEVMPKYPDMREEIETFTSHIQYSMRMATVLIALITLFGAILMYYR